MYKRILLASDLSRESLVALREGALIARAYEAKVFLLIVDPETYGSRLGDSVHPRPLNGEPAALLELALSRLTRLGVSATGEAVIGEPTPLISAAARRFQADLVVVGHRRQSLFDRWWSGSSGAYLADSVNCSLLIARDVVSDAELEARIDGDAKDAAEAKKPPASG
ncbi:MAG TPA: universal stress protein [Caulobacteraceae bacterium]|nr:universal stress protein [Caulobacteraceae bacterium]